MIRRPCLVAWSARSEWRTRPPTSSQSLIQGSIMKKLFGTKRAMVAVGLTAGVAVGLGGSAFAYFTASGSGSGSASVGSSSAITLDGTITGDLYPGGTAAG